VEGDEKNQLKKSRRLSLKRDLSIDTTYSQLHLALPSLQNILPAREGRAIMTASIIFSLLCELNILFTLFS
jgi:hypothetical protein